MSSLMTKVLIVGATSGIGEGFARHLHAKGKHIATSGRRQGRLDALQSDMPGLETMQVRPSWT